MTAKNATMSRRPAEEKPFVFQPFEEKKQQPKWKELLEEEQKEDTKQLQQLYNRMSAKAKAEFDRKSAAAQLHQLRELAFEQIRERAMPSGAKSASFDISRFNINMSNNGNYVSFF